MTRDIVQLIDVIAKTRDCTVLAPSSVPDTAGLPGDLREFYLHCGGLKLYESADYGVEIVRPQKFTRAVESIFPGLTIDEIATSRDDLSVNWYLIADGHDGQTISLDLHPQRLGFCYDTFWDHFAMPGQSPIVARSFYELVTRLYDAKGSYWYWLSDDFERIGDAYDGTFITEPDN